MRVESTACTNLAGYCHPNSRSAFGYFRRSAGGNQTGPLTYP